MKKKDKFMMKNKKNIKKYIKESNKKFYEFTPLLRDVICSKLSREGENILVLFCQTSTLLVSNKNISAGLDSFRVLTEEPVDDQLYSGI